MKHSRIQTATPQQTALIAHLHSLDRRKIERTIEALIAICDMMDGDPDLEDDTEDLCEAGDDGCGPVWHGGNQHWGSVWETAGTE